MNLLLGHVGRRNPVRTSASAEAPSITAAETTLQAFNATECSTIAEVQGILNSQIRAAHTAGETVTVQIGSCLAQYEPGSQASGMTMFGENGFLIGREVHTSLAGIRYIAAIRPYRQ